MQYKHYSATQKKEILGTAFEVAQVGLNPVIFAEDDFELILLPPPPQCWDQKHMLPHRAEKGGNSDIQHSSSVRTETK